MKRLLPILAIGAVLMLGACTGNDTAFGPNGQQSLDLGSGDDHLKTGTDASISPFNWSPPNYAGITGARLVRQADGTLVAEVIDGKERGGANVTLPFGTEPGSPMLTFSSTESKAFDGQKLRADVEKYIAERYGTTWEKLAPEIKSGVELIISGICAAAGIPCAAGGILP